MKKTLLPLLMILFFHSQSLYAQNASTADSAKLKRVEMMPEYPGGIKNLFSYISTNLKYPEIARLTGINGRVVLQFVIDKDGSIQEIKPMTCIGAGCESEAVRVLSSSQKWKPGVQDGRPVRVQYTLPINFNIATDQAVMKEFEKSHYGFVFRIKGEEYQLKEAEKILGNRFPAKWIESALPYPDQAKYSMSNKKEIYLVSVRVPE